MNLTQFVWLLSGVFLDNWFRQQVHTKGVVVSSSEKQSLKSTVGDFAAYVVVRLIVAFIQTLPYDMGDSMCKGLAWLCSDVLKIRHRSTQKNIAAVFPESNEPARRRLGFEMWRNLLLMVCEIAWAQRRLHLVNWHKHVRFVNNRTILRAMLEPRPAVLVSGHFGNFEIGSYTMGLMGCKTVAIARKLDNRFLHDWVDAFRSAKGQQIVDKQGCAPIVEKHLSEGGVLSILADQHAGEKGCWVYFMGVPASCHKALALFSLSADAPMLSGYTRRVDGQPMQFESNCLSIADPANDTEGVCESVTELTEWYNRQLEQCVSTSVEQYWWLHNRWRTPTEKTARRLEKRRIKQLEKRKAA